MRMVTNSKEPMVIIMYRRLMMTISTRKLQKRSKKDSIELFWIVRETTSYMRSLSLFREKF